MKAQICVVVLGLILAASTIANAQTAAVTGRPVGQNVSAATKTADTGAAAPNGADAGVCPPMPANAGGQGGAAFVVEHLLKPGARFSMQDYPPSLLATVQKAEVDRQAKDFPNLCRFAIQNSRIQTGGPAPQVVFLGDSITELWQVADPTFFNTKKIDRGISGQTTPQVLLRFYPDVAALHPRVVHIIAGTNDVAGNTGPETDDTIINNIRAMIELAQDNRIAVVLGSIPPSKVLGKPNQKSATRIVELNRRLRALAAEKKVVYVDYHTPLRDAEGGFQAALSNDGVHPNSDGYKVIKHLAEQAIAKAERVHK